MTAPGEVVEWRREHHFMMATVVLLHVGAGLQFAGGLRLVDVLGAAGWLWAGAIAWRSPRAFRTLAPLFVLLFVVALAFLGAAIAYYPEAQVRPQALLTLRFGTVLGPGALLAVRPPPRKAAERLLLAVGVAGALGAILSLVAYRLGVEAVFAHQTALREGRLENRLGGIVGEAGAFGNYVYVSTGALLVWATVKRVRWTVAAAVAALSVVLFQASLSRASFLATLILFSAVTVGWLAADGRARAALPVALAGAGLMAVIAAPAVAQADAFLRVFGRAPGQPVDLSSGRTDNWEVGLAHVRDNPWLGVGYRGSPVVLGVNTENLVVGLLVDFGPILACVVLVLLLRHVLPIPTGGSYPRGHRLVLTGLVVGQYAQWMFNDIASYHQAFPLMLITLAAGRVTLAGEEPNGEVDGPGLRSSHRQLAVR